MNINELFTTLQKLNINLSNREIANLWGMDEASFSRKKKIGTAIKQKNIEQIEQKYDICLTQSPKKMLNTVQITYRPDVFLSAGYGVEVLDEAKETMTLDARLLTTERGCRINPQHCEIVSVSGNSMAPEYRHGDKVIIDRGDTELVDGHIFAFRYNGQCYVKEINLLGDKIKCISLNKEYDPFYINQGEQFTVLGRIIPRIRL